MGMLNILHVSCHLLLLVLNVELAVGPADATSKTTVTTDTQVGKSTVRATRRTRPSDAGLSVNVSWWAESVSLALDDLAARALGHDQLQQLYDNSVCMMSLQAPDDVNISQHVLDIAATFSQFILINHHRRRR